MSAKVVLADKEISGLELNALGNWRFIYISLPCSLIAMLYIAAMLKLRCADPKAAAGGMKERASQIHGKYYYYSL